MKTKLVVILLAAAISPLVQARPLAERVRSASEVIVNRQTSVKTIPQWVIDRTKCVASLRVVKAGLIWGGQGSTGVVSCRTEDNEWSTPSFFNVSGVNFGFQIGVQLLETVLMFITDFARDILNRTTFQMGADVSFAAGPVGAGGGAGELPNAHILSYQRAVGLYAGATVNGFVLSHNPRLNEEAYGSQVTAAELLETPGVEGPQVVQPLVETMSRYLPTH